MTKNASCIVTKTFVLFAWISILFLNSACTQQEEIQKETTTPLYSRYDFPNILNLQGTPDSATDRSVYAFSDYGAWFAYALPGSEQPELKGSFSGPFLMTQDNGCWISPVLSQLEIIDAATATPLDLKNASIEEIHSYPGKLQQILHLHNPNIRITSELIFISDRTALSRLHIQNLAASTDIRLRIKWLGKSFLEGSSFIADQQSIKIDFSKNDHIGMISIPDDTSSHLEVQNEHSYEIITADKSLSGNEQKTWLIAHTFCFSHNEWLQEQQMLHKAFNTPDIFFSENEQRWDRFINGITAELPPHFNHNDHHRIAVKCLETLLTNWRSPAGFFPHAGLFPSYHYEWFHGYWAWDSWKHAVALAHFDPKLARNQIQAMYDFQDEMGMIADCVYRDTVIEAHNWRNTKPPLSAWASWKVFEKEEDKLFLKELFPKLEQYHQWWYQYRDHDQNGLCEYGSTDGSLIAAKWESGMDNAVRFDETTLVKNNDNGWSMNRESVDLNAYLFAEKQYLAKIATQIGETEKADKYTQDALQLKDLIQNYFYDETSGWFYDIDLDSKKHYKTYGAEGWIPLWAEIATPEQAAKLRKIMIDTTKFATYIPFPTLAADHPKFDPNGSYWRGPVWIDQAYFAIKGLRNYGYEEDAQRFSEHLFERLEGLKNDDLPIRENYHPLTGEGLESHHFSWSAAHLLLLLWEE